MAITQILQVAWIPPLLNLVLNSVSGIQVIVLMFGDFSKNLSHITFLSKFEGYGGVSFPCQRII